MHVHVGEGGQQQPSAPLDDGLALTPGRSRAALARAYLRDRLALDQDIGRCSAPRAHVGDPHGPQPRVPMGPQS